MAQYSDVFAISYRQCLKLQPLRIYDPEYTNTTIQTPNGYPVNARKLIENTDLKDNEKRGLKNKVETQYPGAVILSEATGKYNCHAYAWHHQKVPTSDPVWINDPYMYWLTGCYYEVPIDEAEIVTYKYNGKITHSAVRINNNEYISKWGPWPLVRHSPTNVPNNYADGYYGEVYKGYKRLDTTLSGNGLIKTSSTFSVGHIPSCYYIDWTLSDSYYSQNCMTVNDDETCTITRNDTHDIYDATLSATIKFNGYNALRLSKQVFAYKDFRGTYDCAGANNASLTYPYIINTKLDDNVVIKSPSLKGATVTYEGDITPRYFNVYNQHTTWDGVDYGVISTGLSSTGMALVMHVVTTENEKYDLIILAQSRARSITTTFEDSLLSIRYGQDSDTHTDYSEYLSTETSDGASISVEIRDLLTNSMVYGTRSTDQEVLIYTGDLKPGVYIVTARAENEVMTKKILIK